MPDLAASPASMCCSNGSTVHLYQPFGPRDTFIAMVSSHVDRGRRNLARFDEWLAGVGAAITVNPRGAVYLVPPRWA